MQLGEPKLSHSLGGQLGDLLCQWSSNHDLSARLVRQRQAGASEWAHHASPHERNGQGIKHNLSCHLEHPLQSNKRCASSLEGTGQGAQLCHTIDKAKSAGSIKGHLSAGLQWLHLFLIDARLPHLCRLCLAGSCALLWSDLLQAPSRSMRSKATTMLRLLAWVGLLHLHLITLQLMRSDTQAPRQLRLSMSQRAWELACALCLVAPRWQQLEKSARARLTLTAWVA